MRPPVTWSSEFKQPRHIKRMHEGRGIGQPEADMLGHPRHCRDKRAHVLARPADAPLDRGLDRVAPGVRDAGAVAEEDEVEQAALGDPRDLLVHPDIGKGACGSRSRECASVRPDASRRDRSRDAFSLSCALTQMPSMGHCGRLQPVRPRPAFTPASPQGLSPSTDPDGTACTNRTQMTLAASPIAAPN